MSGNRSASVRPGPSFRRQACFRSDSGQRLARTGKNLTWPGARWSGPGGDRNAARRDRRGNRPFGNVCCVPRDISRGQRRTQRGRSRRGGRNVHVSFTGYCLRSLRCRFVPGSRGCTLDSWSSFGYMFRGGYRLGRGGSRRSIRFPRQPPLDLYRYRFIDRTGVGFLFSNAQLRKHVEDHVRFYLELSGQFVDTNFDHTVCPAVQFRHRGYQIKPCSLSRASAPAGGSAISIVTDCPCGSSASSLPAPATGSAGVASPSPPDSNCP
jgi:hypothetical protein